MKEGVGCGVWGVGKETSFICRGENFFIGTDLKEAVGRGQGAGGSREKYHFGESVVDTKLGYTL
ncbi:hypothetical protein RVR34_10730 [Microcystis aeruginosa FBCC-A68]|uniref:hypothetical protein n=1 Tax=Microcystis aeruginosa TaxID=1126 RepID=UPI0014836897|nr:hypothetical protein [Microcystis aeruginosa]